MQEVSCCVEFYFTLFVDFSDDEGDGSDKKANEEPEEFGKFLHLKERVGTTVFTINFKSSVYHDSDDFVSPARQKYIDNASLQINIERARCM